MIKIGILSDTHGSIHSAVISLMNECDYIIHAGDIVDESSLSPLKPKQKMIAVQGNNDQHIGSYGEVEQLDLPGGSIAIEHGHLHGNIQPDHDSLRGAHSEAKVIVYGHTHKQVIDKAQKPWVINPGSAGQIRNYGAARCLTIEIENKQDWDIKSHVFDDIF